MQETQERQVQFLEWGDPLEKEMAIHSSVLAWRIPWMEKSGGLQSMGSHRVGHDWSDVVVVVVVYNLVANTSKGVVFLLPSDAYVRSFLYLLYTLIKTLLHKSSERSSLVSGSGLNSSPLGAKNPCVFTWFNNNLSFLCIDHWRRLSYLSLLFFGTRYWGGYIFLFSFAFSFSSFLSYL